MKRLAVILLFLATMGSLSGQRVTGYSFGISGRLEMPKNTHGYWINELITPLGKNYVVRMWKGSTYYAIIDENLNIINKVKEPDIRVQYSYVDGAELHLIGFPGKYSKKEIVHYSLNLFRMEFSEPEVLAKQRVLAKTNGRTAKEIRDFDLYHRRRYRAELLNFDKMLVVRSANKRYTLIVPYYHHSWYLMSAFGNSFYINGAAFCSGLMLFDNKMNKLAEQENIDTFLVRYNQIGSAQSEMFNEGKTYYYRPEKFTNLYVHINDDGLVTALYSRKKLHIISGSEFAVSLLYPDGRYQSIELGKIMGDENMDRPFIMSCDGEKLLFAGYYTSPTKHYHLIHNCKVHGIGTYEVDLKTHDVKMVDRKEFSDSLEFVDILTYLWKLDSGFVAEMSKTWYYPKTEKEEAFYAVHGSCYASIGNDGKIRRAVSRLRCEDDSTYVTYPIMLHPIVHKNKIYYFSRKKDYVYVMDYLCRVRGEVMRYNPFIRWDNVHFLENAGPLREADKHLWLGISDNTFKFGSIKFIDDDEQ